MAKIHILECDDDGNYRMVIHSPVPVGNNAAGISWKTAGLAAGKLGASILAAGTGPGQIAAAEQASIAGGDLMETMATVKAESGGATVASINDLADRAITDRRATLARQLKYYGFTNG